MQKKPTWQLYYDLEYTFSPVDKKIVDDNDKLVIFDDGSKYHRTNKLNDLTSKDWLKFQKSWFVPSPKPRQDDVVLHPAKYPEELVQQFIEFFTKRGATVLDPMVGTGSTLIACAHAGRNGIGVELLEKYAAITKQRLGQLSIPVVDQTEHGSQKLKLHLKLIRGDALALSEMPISMIDYCITSPPYWDMLTQKGFETQQRRKENELDVYYSEDPRDLGNVKDYKQFLDRLTTVYRGVHRLLKPGGYLTIVVKNIKKGGKIYPLAWDLASRLQEFFELKDEKIWCQDDIKLAPYGYGNAWVSNTMHHYCLNFKKEQE